MNPLQATTIISVKSYNMLSKPLDEKGVRTYKTRSIGKRPYKIFLFQFRFHLTFSGIPEGIILFSTVPS